MVTPRCDRSALRAVAGNRCRRGSLQRMSAAAFQRLLRNVRFHPWRGPIQHHVARHRNGFVAEPDLFAQFGNVILDLLDLVLKRIGRELLFAFQTRRILEHLRDCLALLQNFVLRIISPDMFDMRYVPN